MKSRIYLQIIGITIITLFALVSCNLQGEGIFQSISRASETDNPDLYRTTALEIIGEKDNYILAYTDGRVLHAFKDDSWTTLKRTNVNKDVVITNIVMDDNKNILPSGTAMLPEGRYTRQPWIFLVVLLNGKLKQ